MFPASAGIKTFSVCAIGLFLPAAPEVFRLVDVRRVAGVFLIFISLGDPPASGGPPAVSAWAVFFFFGTDQLVLMISIWAFVKNGIGNRQERNMCVRS